MPYPSMHVIARTDIYLLLQLNKNKYLILKTTFTVMFGFLKKNIFYIIIQTGRGEAKEKSVNL